jgi:hypothetical protein
MSSSAAVQIRIHTHLERVAEVRARAARDAVFGSVLARLKRWQAARLSQTYDDLRAEPRYRAAVDFFVTDLYGDRDFSARDAGLARIVPAIARLFPPEALAMVDAALHLHALSETLDARMVDAHPALLRLPSEARAGLAAAQAPDWDADSYASAWRVVGEPALRARQLAIVGEIGHALDSLVQLPLIGLTLRAMKGPAALADLSELHEFLLRGYTAFRALRGAEAFLTIVDERESAFLRAQFGAAGAGEGSGGSPAAIAPQPVEP